MKKVTIQAVKLTSLALLTALRTDASLAQDSAKVNPPAAAGAGAPPAVAAPGAQKAAAAATTKEAPSTAPLANAMQNADPAVQEAIKKALAGATVQAKQAADAKVANQAAVPATVPAAGGAAPAAGGVAPAAGGVGPLGDASDTSSQGIKFTQDYLGYGDDDRCYDANDNYICDDLGNPIVPGAAPAPGAPAVPGAPVAAAPIDPITKIVNDAIRNSISEAEKGLETYKTAQANFVAEVMANNVQQIVATGPAYKDALVKAIASVVAALNILSKDSAKTLLGADTTTILNEKYTKAKTELDTLAGLGQ